MWIIFGTKDEAVRVPGGLQVVRHCDACGETTTFYEKDITSTFRLYFIDVLDYKKHRVMQCGACGAQYATDELGAHDRDLTGTVGKKLEQGGEAVGRFASSVTEKLADLAGRATSSPARPRPRREERPSSAKDSGQDLSDDDLAAMDELEMKFRALEKEEERRKRGR